MMDKACVWMELACSTRFSVSQVATSHHDGSECIHTNTCSGHGAASLPQLLFSSAKLKYEQSRCPSVCHRPCGQGNYCCFEADLWNDHCQMTTWRSVSENMEGVGP